jgi:hypothetical protein
MPPPEIDMGLAFAATFDKTKVSNRECLLPGLFL